MTRKVSGQVGLTVVLLLGLLIRIYAILAFPFEQDELYTVDEATNLFHTKLLPGIQARPVFFLLEHPLVTNLPHTPLVLRMFPLICGMLGIWVTWLLARRIVGESAALFAAFLAAVSPWHMYASGFGRYYALLYLLAVLGYWLLPTAYDSDNPKTYLATLAAFFFGAWTHPSFAFPIVGAAFAVMLFTRDGSVRWRWPSRNGWLYLWIPLVVCSAIAAAVIHKIHRVSVVTNGGDRGLLATLRLIPAMVDWMTPMIFVTGAIGALLLACSNIPERRRFGFMAIFGVVAMLAALFALSFMTSIYADYGISALPLIFVAAAGLLQWVIDAIPAARQRGVVYAIGAVIVVGTLPSVASYLSDGMRFDYRPAYARIAADGPQHAVVTWPVIIFRNYAPELHGYELPDSPAKLDSLLVRERDLWTVTSVKRYGIVGDDSGQIAQWLRANCREVDEYQRPRFDYRLYRVDLWRCTAGS